jgi:hypothetical protein
MTEQTIENDQTDEPPLLTYMPKIAEVVNAFTSDDTKRIALEALVRQFEPAYTVTPVTTLPVQQVPLIETTTLGASAAVETADPAPLTASVPAPAKKVARKASVKKTFTIPRDLNFAPEGKQSLADFLDEKQPRTHHERNLVACYYLQHVMGLAPVGVEQVLAVYRAAGWDAPAQPEVYLRKTASMFGWIDTANTKDIKVVWAGENFLTSKMPTEGRGKKN